MIKGGGESFRVTFCSLADFSSKLWASAAQSGLLRAVSCGQKKLCVEGGGIKKGSHSATKVF